MVDHEFGTTDVLIVLPVSAIKQRYIEHFAVEPPGGVASQPPQRHFLDLVALALLQDEVGALARRQDIFVQIDAG